MADFAGSPRVTRAGSGWAGWCLVAASACATPLPPPIAPADATLTSDRTSYAQLMGRRRSAMDAQLTPGTPSSEATDWVIHSDRLRAWYEGDEVRAMKIRVPDRLDCLQAAQWVGYADAAEPQVEQGRCVWSTEGMSHALAPAREATFDPQSRIFHVVMVR